MSTVAIMDRLGRIDLKRTDAFRMCQARPRIARSRRTVPLANRRPFAHTVQPWRANGRRGESIHESVRRFWPPPTSSG
jgi:hypothetical protein